jgi:toxin ParE1/3/4
MKIRWTPPAVGDLKGIGDYIEEQDGAKRARQITRIIYEAVRSLGQMPYRGRRGRLNDTRELILPNLPFLVVYRPRDTELEILRILHGAQRWP